MRVRARVSVCVLSLRHTLCVNVSALSCISTCRYTNGGVCANACATGTHLGDTCMRVRMRICVCLCVAHEVCLTDSIHAHASNGLCASHFHELDRATTLCNLRSRIITNTCCVTQQDGSCYSSTSLNVTQVINSECN